MAATCVWGANTLDLPLPDVTDPAGLGRSITQRLRAVPALSLNAPVPVATAEGVHKEAIWSASGWQDRHLRRPLQAVGTH